MVLAIVIVVVPITVAADANDVEPVNAYAAVVWVRREQGVHGVLVGWVTKDSETCYY